jgi:hypothetical protein
LELRTRAASLLVANSVGSLNHGATNKLLSFLPIHNGRLSNRIFAPDHSLMVVMYTKTIPIIHHTLVALHLNMRPHPGRMASSSLHVEATSNSSKGIVTSFLFKNNLNQRRASLGEVVVVVVVEVTAHHQRKHGKVRSHRSVMAQRQRRREGAPLIEDQFHLWLSFQLHKEQA